MNLSVFFTIIFISLISQTPSTTCLRSDRKINRETQSLLDGTKLILSLESGNTAIRRPRGSENIQTDTLIAAEDSKLPTNAGASNEKRLRPAGHGSRKMSRNPDINAPIGGRNKHHMEKKPLNSGEYHQHQAGKRRQQANRQQIGNPKGNDPMKVLKSRQHQENSGHQGNKRNNGHKVQSENDEHGKDVGKAQSTCRYTKSAWSDCDAKTNTHSRTLTLKRGDSNCLPTRTIQKKCKKACRYEKGSWSECKDGQMTRLDKLKTITDTSTVSTIDSSCETMRSVKRKCNPGGNAGKSSSKSHQNGNGKSNKKERKNKEKANNRGTQQQT